MARQKQSSGKTIAFLGAGNMAEALMSGFISAKIVPARRIIAADVRLEHLGGLRRHYGIATASDNAAAVARADIIFLAVKPQQIQAVLAQVGPSVTRRQLVISIAAGVTTRFIESFLPARVPVVRAMPNTPAIVRSGATAIARGTAAGPVHERIAQKLFSTVGTVAVVREKDINAVTALSGSGPAYVFYLCEALEQAGASLGLPRAVAGQLARQTLFGAGLMLTTSSDEAAELRRKVTSPGGTTEAAIARLEKHRVRQAVTDALMRACKRAAELSR